MLEFVLKLADKQQEGEKQMSNKELKKEVGNTDSKSPFITSSHTLQLQSCAM